eukprot:4975050-Pyramimonas_sp.AAC.1
MMYQVQALLQIPIGHIHMVMVTFDWLDYYMYDVVAPSVLAGGHRYVVVVKTKHRVSSTSAYSSSTIVRGKHAASAATPLKRARGKGRPPPKHRLVG